MNGNVPVQTGWLDTFKTRFNIDAFADKANLSKDKLIDVGLYLAIGFFVGFLLKRFGEYIIIAILLAVGLSVAQQYGLVNLNINWEQIQTLFGMHSVTMIDNSWVATSVEWIKSNIVIVISAVIGFLLGLRVS